MTITTLPHITFLFNPLPTAGEPIWDAECQEWVLVDSDGISYCGNTPGECALQFLEALRVAADHYRKNP